MNELEQLRFVRTLNVNHPGISQCCDCFFLIVIDVVLQIDATQITPNSLMRSVILGSV